MRPRRRRSTRRRVSLKLPPLLPLLAFVLVGALGGAALASQALASLSQPEPVDESRWIVLIPGMDEQVTTPMLGRGSRVGAGMLTLVPHSFGRADRLLPRDDRPFARLEIELHPRSGPLLVNLVPPGQSSTGITSLRLSPEAWMDPSGQSVPVPPGEPAVLLQEGAVVKALSARGPVPLIRQPEGTIELSALAGTTRLRSIRALAADGTVIVEDRWSEAPVPLPGRLLCAAGGALIGLAAGLVALSGASLPGGAILSLLLLLPPALVLAMPHALWLALVERLFLVRTTTWALAQMTFVAALLPLFGAALLRSRLLQVPAARRGDLPQAVWIGAILLASALASRELSGLSWLGAPLGAAFLALPLYLAHKGRLSSGELLLRDLPALFSVALLGWSGGLVFAVLWRLLLLLALVPVLVERAPRAGTDMLFVTLLAFPLGVELGIRATYLGTGWSAEHLSGAELGAGEDASGVVPYWSDSCGQDPAVVWWFGGSSAGGAYQLGGKPGSFFPGQVHERLCAEGIALRTVNYANGGRDSFTFSRALDGLLAGEAPDVTVVYVGVNDLLTKNSSKTRKQREAERAEAEKATGLLVGLSARSRLVSGLSLLARPISTVEKDFVSAVPIEDAEENLRRMIRGLAARGGRVLLVPELTRPTGTDPMTPYRLMQARLAAEEDAAEWLDAVQAMAEVDPEQVFIDRNHLSFTGHTELAARIAPVLASMITEAPLVDLHPDEKTP